MSVEAVQTEASSVRLPLRILSITTLYPNPSQPSHGIFVENRLRQLAATDHVSLRVVAPIPWFPFRHRIFGRYAQFGEAPTAETRHGIAVTHPRYLAIPRIGMLASPALLAVALSQHLRTILKGGLKFDLVDAHFFYPDGVAAAWIARRLGLPVVITARGTDLNDYASRYPLVRRIIRRTAMRADGLITVCEALKDVLVELGIAANRIHVFRNGVDLDLFKPYDRSAAARVLNVHGTVIASVGHLIPRKGHEIVIRALVEVPNTTLIVAGDGPQRGMLQRLSHDLGVGDRVRFLGQVAHAELVNVYNAADVLVLASSREGWANVLLEAMACGTPVVASDIWGTPEVVRAPAAGLLVGERTVKAFAAAIRGILSAPPSRLETRAYAEGFSWDRTTQGQIDLFRTVIDAHAGNRASEESMQRLQA